MTSRSPGSLRCWRKDTTLFGSTYRIWGLILAPWKSGHPTGSQGYRSPCGKAPKLATPISGLPWSLPWLLGVGMGDHPPYSIHCWIWQAPLGCGSKEISRHTLCFGRPPTALAPTLAVGQSHAPSPGLFRSSPSTFVRQLLPDSGSKWSK
jgi:hypothetical protein